MEDTPRSSFRIIQKIVIAVGTAAFFFALVQTTESLYSKTTDAGVLRPDNILAGLSEAPNQYRVLVPLLYHLLRSRGHIDADKSDRIVILASIILCYAAAGALFYKSSRSLPLTMLSLVALLGSFSYGMLLKYRQEFFEVAFVSLFFLVLLTSRGRLWSSLALVVITVLGSLNRETFVFCIAGMTVHLLSRLRAASRDRTILRDGILAAGLFLIFAAIFVGVRYYFGLSHYSGGFWQFRANLSNFLALTHPINALHMGAGMLLAYATTLVCGNGEYLPFILGYAIPMFLVAFFISRFAEHRIFYPLMVLLIASILRFATNEPRVKPRAEAET